MPMFIIPNWPAPQNIKSFSTLRIGGVSSPPYHSLNIGVHVADKIENVIQNRQIIRDKLHLPKEPVWTKQVHGKIVLSAIDENQGKIADATYAQAAHQICVIQTADCLPILLCDQKGTFVAAIHGGWRGLAKKIITETLHTINPADSEILAWLGPAIGPKMYKVGEEVHAAFPGADYAFTSIEPKQWLCDLYGLARMELQENGITSIYGGEYCTYSDSDRFFSYRRDGKNTGRMATLIWIE